MGRKASERRDRAGMSLVMVQWGTGHTYVGVCVLFHVFVLFGGTEELRNGTGVLSCVFP